MLFCWHAKGKFVFADSQRNPPILIQDASRRRRLGLDSVSPVLVAGALLAYAMDLRPGSPASQLLWREDCMIEHRSATSPNGNA